MYYEMMEAKAQEIFDKSLELYPDQSGSRTRYHKKQLEKLEQPDRGVVRQYIDRIIFMRRAKARSKTHDFGSSLHPRYGNRAKV